MIPFILAGAALGALFISGCSSNEEEKPTMPSADNIKGVAKQKQEHWLREDPKQLTKFGPYACYYKADTYWPPISERFKGATSGPIFTKAQHQYCEEQLCEAEKGIREFFSGGTLECSLTHGW